MANETYDVFVSYSRADWRHAADIDTALRGKGLKPFFDRRSLAPGLPWPRALEHAIGAARSAIILIGPHGLGNTQQYERELLVVRLTRDPAFLLVPVILPATKDPPFDFLQVLTWIDFSHVTKVSDAPRELEDLLTAVEGGQTSTGAAREAICPYRGLDAFREEDAAFFFGRGSAEDTESPIGQLVRKVHEHPFVMVVGRSGTGKSSLIYAGLIPTLRRERNRFWNVVSLRPGPTPLRALAAAFYSRVAEDGPAEYAAKIGEEAAKLRTGDPELLSHMIREELDRAEGKPDRLLLYIDQWEELYAQAPSSSDMDRVAQHAADVNRFIDLLLTAARSAPVTVIATMRADFYDPLIGHQEMRSLLPSQQLLLGSMSRSELESTIVEPARKVELAFDPPNLVQRILDEAGEDEGMLPLLQYALKETWSQRKGSMMTGDSYARSGGVREAIRITAERTFDALSPTDQRAARQLFLRLVTPGEGQEDTRARAAMPLDLAQRKIVEQFAGPRTRLLVTGWDRAARPTVEVAHEALIRTWPRLRDWIDANREKLRARAAILHSKAEWEHHARRNDLLLPAGFQLERARALLADPGDLTIDDIEEFITLSSSARDEAVRTRTEEIIRERQKVVTEQHERELVQARELAEARRKTTKRTLVGAAGAVLFAIFAIGQGIYAQALKVHAEIEAARADQEANVARLQAQLAKVSIINFQRTYLESRANTNLNFYFELERHRQRGQTLNTRAQAEGDAADTKQSREILLNEAGKLGADLTQTISEIRRENERVWLGLSEADRSKVAANIAEHLRSFPYGTLENKLRVALYAIAAIPEDRAILNNSLRGIIEESRQRGYFRVPSASQLWGLAFTERRPGQLAAIGDDNGVVWIWDPLAASAGTTKNLTAASGVVNGLAFNANGTLLAAAYRNGGVAVWDLDKTDQGPLCPLRPAGENSGAYGVAFSGAFLAIASADKAVHLWDVSQKGCPAVPNKTFRRNDLVFGVAFSPDGKLVAAASGDGTVAVWDIDLTDHPMLDVPLGKPMFAVAFSPDGKTLGATGADGVGYLWQMDGQQFSLPTILLKQGGTLGQISFSPDGQMVVATAGATGTAFVTAVKMNARGLALDGGGQSLFGVAFSPDSKYLLTGSNLLNTVRLLEIDSHHLWDATNRGHQLWDVTHRDELISLGVKRVAGMQLDPTECGVLREMEIPIFNIMQWAARDMELVCPFPFLGPG